MRRYAIIDLEKANFISPYGEASVPITTITTSAILSEAETEAKFKQIWDDGVSSAMGSLQPRGTFNVDKIDRQWQEIKNVI